MAFDKNDDQDAELLGDMVRRENRYNPEVIALLDRLIEEATPDSGDGLRLMSAKMQILAAQEALRKRDQLVRENRRLRARATRDEATRLLNKKGLEERSYEAVDDFLRSGNTWIVLFLDMDNFKWFNDFWSHDEGDRVVEALGRGTKGTLRAYTYAGRLSKGADEIVVLAKITEENRMRLARRLRRNILQQIHRFLLEKFSAGTDLTSTIKKDGKVQAVTLTYLGRPDDDEDVVSAKFEDGTVTELRFQPSIGLSMLKRDENGRETIASEVLQKLDGGLVSVPLKEIGLVYPQNNRRIRKSAKLGIFHQAVGIAEAAMKAAKIAGGGGR